MLGILVPYVAPYLEGILIVTLPITILTLIYLVVDGPNLDGHNRKPYDDSLVGWIGYYFKKVVNIVAIISVVIDATILFFAIVVT